jgi:hypothetical protein
MMQKIKGLELFENLVRRRKLFTLVPVLIFTAYVYLFLNDSVGMPIFSYFYPIFDVLSAFILSFLISIIITVNYYIIEAKKHANEKNTAVAIFFSLITTPFCCNVLIPLFVAFIFGSTALSPIYLSTQTILVDSDAAIIIASMIIIYIFYRKSLDTFRNCRIKLGPKAGVARI